MEINKHHRLALLDALETAETQKRITRSCLASEDPSKHPTMVHGFEVADFLDELRIDAIKKALIDNELFNY